MGDNGKQGFVGETENPTVLYNAEEEGSDKRRSDENGDYKNKILEIVSLG